MGKIKLFAPFMNTTNLNVIEVTGGYLRMCVESPTIPSFWERFIFINKFLIKHQDC